MTLRSFCLITASLLALSACDMGKFNGELGAEVDEGGFGNATMNNTMIQSGERDFTIALAERFAAEVPSTITFAFNSSALTDQARATQALKK